MSGIGLHDFNLLMQADAICLGVDFVDVSWLGRVDTCGIVFMDRRWDSMMDKK